MARRRKKLPIDPVTADIRAMSHDGRGITQINGKTTFVFGALPDEQVSFTYTATHGKYDEGLTQEVLKASPQRVTPRCAQFGICGGCRLQHFDAAEQIIFKQQGLLEQLQHIGHVTPEQILAPITGPIWGYRRKARLGVRFVIKKDKVLVGFRELGGRYITNTEMCHVLHPSVGEKIAALQSVIASLSLYQLIPQIEVAIADNVNALIFRHLEPLPESDIEKLKTFAKTENFQLYLQPNKADSIHCIWPEKNVPPLCIDLPDHNVSLQFLPSDFTQVNHDINRAMINQALELLDPQPNERILDLFCGLGNFSLPLAKRCQQLIGIEGDQGLVERAAENAARNDIHNTEFLCADLCKNLDQAEWAKQHYDKILIDPPRSGALELMHIIPTLNPKRIVYVSCHPATLARDAGELVKLGYQLRKAGVMDMFPHTSHVESMALFERA